MKVTLSHLTKIFQQRNTKKKDHLMVTAVDDLSYEFPDGKLVALLGPSGCGKSTTLYLICGLETPTSGQIMFGDVDVTNVPPENRGVGLVFQNYALYPHLTVKQNILFPLQNLKGEDKLTKEEMEDRVNKVVKLVQIEPYLDRKPSQLSGGQQQRVAIARALVKMPDILLLDEPLSNLDARLRLQTREEIRKIQKATNITTIFVTHDQEEAMSIADYILVMKKGALQQVGKPQEVYDNPVNLFVAKFLGTPQINIFTGKIKDGYLYIGDDKLFETKCQDMDVYVGIRPEGFIVKDDGCFHAKMIRTEVRGRDIMVVSQNDNVISDGEPLIRTIVDSDVEIDENKEIVSFDLKKHKTLVFNKETEERIYLD